MAGVGRDAPARCMASFGVQVGESCVDDLLKETYNPVLTNDRRLDRILKEIQKKWTLGDFLCVLFTLPKSGQLTRSKTHSTTVSRFLKGQAGTPAQEIVELMYSNNDSTPKAVRNTATPNRQVSRPDHKPMARWQLQEWAIRKVEDIIDREAMQVSGKDGSFHLTKAETVWDFIHGFTLSKVVEVVETQAPVLLRLLIASAIPAPQRVLPQNLPEDLSSMPYATYFSCPAHAGSGGSRRDPWVIMIVACMMLMYARNLHFSMFRKITGLWLFANSASDGIFSVLSRIGLSASYTTVLKVLRQLSQSAKEMIREKAQLRAFLLIYDNINRMQRAWEPDLGQRDMMNSGSAATFIVLEDCDVYAAFDVSNLKNAQAQRGRKNLDTEVLFKRMNLAELHAIFGLHSVGFLIQDVSCLNHHQEYINIRFQTTHQSHRMRKGRKTTVHPLATSDHDEGSTEGNQKVIDDLLLNQLNMDKAEIEKLMVIIGGDQSTVEKIRTLKKFLSTCPHGYSRYGWVLPLIQLWHMGWADLERVLSTHWGKASADSKHGDMSTFYFTNTILKRKIKDVKHPDYYPTQSFVFDNLKVEILDCWKVLLNTDNLEDYFQSHPMEIEDLMHLGNDLVKKYLSTDAAEKARYGDQSHGIAKGTPWSVPSVSSDMIDTAAMDTDSDDEYLSGDQVLANSILRMRDSMLHYEFQFAVADGDIGRAMNVMAVWTFTFTGCGKNKYSNELLELACNFEYEYSEALQTAILNNWLCNLSGIEGCWFPMDLLQEHNIRQLKKMSERRDAGFGGVFFKEIIAYNIRAFLDVNVSMKTAVRLNAKGGAHRRKKKEAAMKQLGVAMRERELHRYRSGRSFGHIAQDDFSAGYKRFTETTRIKDFITRTMADAGDIQGEDDISLEPVSELQSSVPLPGVVVDEIFQIDDELGDGNPGDGDETGSESSDEELW